MVGQEPSVMQESGPEIRQVVYGNIFVSYTNLYRIRLSGQPNITSDMDGIFGGKKPIINTRDFQWKAFTPMQLNMDGWGSNEKYPHALEK